MKVRFFTWLATMAGIIVATLTIRHYEQGSETVYFMAVAITMLSVSTAIWARPLIDHLIAPKDGDSREIFIGVICVGLGGMAFVFLFAGTRNWETLKLGTYGDFVGGTLNPILTFLTFVGLLFTIILQQRELHNARTAETKAETDRGDQKKVDARQQFEYTFFQMLTLHTTLVNSLDLRSAPGEALREWHGRDCFERYLATYRAGYNKGKDEPNELKRLDRAYDYLWEARQQDLAHYFRYLYNVIKFVDEYEPKIEGMAKYMKLLRAQLSDYELLILFYNGLSVNGANYRNYIIKYELFDNMPQNKLLMPKHKACYPAAAYGEPKNPTPNREWSNEL